MSNTSAIIAVDIGNSRLKAALFQAAELEASRSAGRLPAASAMVQVPATAEGLRALGDWLRARSGGLDRPSFRWAIGSVAPATLRLLTDWLREQPCTDLHVLDDYRRLPLAIDLPNRAGVGIDRLLNAVAVNRLRSPLTPAIIVDAGSAITVDAISPQGVFLGGAILPGLHLAARALKEFTAALPLVEVHSVPWVDAPPKSLGRCTEEAIQSGLAWGCVGAVGELISQLTQQLDWREPLHVFTGGDGLWLAEQIAAATPHLPDLTLQGIAITATELGPTLNCPTP